MQLCWWYHDADHQLSLSTQALIRVCGACAHEYVTSLANHEPWLKVKILKNMINVNAFTMKKVLDHERGQIQ